MRVKMPSFYDITFSQDNFTTRTLLNFEDDKHLSDSYFNGRFSCYDSEKLEAFRYDLYGNK